MCCYRDPGNAPILSPLPCSSQTEYGTTVQPRTIPCGLVVWRADQGMWGTLLRIREKGGLAFPAVHLTLS